MTREKRYLPCRTNRVWIRIVGIAEEIFEGVHADHLAMISPKELRTRGANGILATTAVVSWLCCAAMAENVAGKIFFVRLESR